MRTATLPMGLRVTAFEPLPAPHLDTGLRIGGVLLRCVAYALLASVASRYDFGRSLLCGVLVGDVAATLLSMAWRWTDGERGVWFAELAVLALVVWWIRPDRMVPERPDQRAIFVLAAFGAFVGRAGGNALVRFGPSGNGAL